MKFIKKLCRGKYDPVEYWSSRTNPNNELGESKDRVNFDVSYIKKFVGNLEEATVLELGPGVGRTFSAYSGGQTITTLDISTKYSEKLALTAEKSQLNLTQQHLKPMDSFPFEDQSFAVGVASQVLLHIPPENIRHTIKELARVCENVVIITAYVHESSNERASVNHVFNHDYIGICTDLGCAMHNVIMNEGRICFTLRKWSS